MSERWKLKSPFGSALGCVALLNLRLPSHRNNFSCLTRILRESNDMIILEHCHIMWAGQFIHSNVEVVFLCFKLCSYHVLIRWPPDFFQEEIKSVCSWCTTQKRGDQEFLCEKQKLGAPLKKKNSNTVSLCWWRENIVLFWSQEMWEIFVSPVWNT